MQTKARTQNLFELHTKIDLDGLEHEECRLFAAALRDGIREAATDHPTVSEFFVHIEDTAPEAVVGLRIRKPTDKGLEDIADAVLNQGLENAEKQVRSTMRVSAIRETETALA